MQFKVGDKVKYVRRYNMFIDYNVIGTIAYKDKEGWAVLFSNNIMRYCVEKNLVKMPSKNQQLLFNFMD